VPIEIVVPLRVRNNRLASRGLDLANHIVMAPEQLEAELHQQITPSGETDVGAHDYPAYDVSVGGPDLLTEGDRWKIRAPGARGGEVIECAAVTFQLAVHCLVVGELREQQVRCGHQCTNIFLIQYRQGVKRLRHTRGAVVHARDEVTMKIDDGKRRVGRGGHD
jgi:hypothetical protein